MSEASGPTGWPAGWPPPEEIEAPRSLRQEPDRERWGLALRAAHNMLGASSLDHVIMTAVYLYRSDIPSTDEQRATPDESS
jgi:hypothetical protein